MARVPVSCQPESRCSRMAATAMVATIIMVTMMVAAIIMVTMMVAAIIMVAMVATITVATVMVAMGHGVPMRDDGETPT